MKIFKRLTLSIKDSRMIDRLNAENELLRKENAELQDAIVELGELFAEQEDALVEIASLMEE